MVCYGKILFIGLCLNLISFAFTQATDILNGILEGYPKPKKQLIVSPNFTWFFVMCCYVTSVTVSKFHPTGQLTRNNNLLEPLLN